MVIKMNKKRILLFCAHPDDAELCAGGTIKKFVSKGYKVKVVIMTNGGVGNNDMNVSKTVDIRNVEMQNAASFLNYEVKNLNINDGEVLPTLEYRKLVIDEIRKFKPDIIMTHRSNDYHPDHRYTSILVQDSLVLICTGNYCPTYSPLNYTPITLFFWDRFTKPNSFNADIVYDITNEFEDKVEALSKHKSQYKSIDECRNVLIDINNELKQNIESSYKYIEAFEICEYAKKDELMAFLESKNKIFG